MIPRLLLATAAAATLALTTVSRATVPETVTLDFREIVQSAKDKVFPAVVYIRVVAEDFQGGKKESYEASGSGVIISPDGEILTNWHVIDKATRVRCLLSDGQHFEADILGSDKDTDLALIKLQLPDDHAYDLPTADFGDSSQLSEGDFVMAMGAPWGLNRSVSIGIISCTSRYLENTSEYSHWLQTDAAINPGNSGGPLVDTQGRIIGINTRGGGENLGFAVPTQAIDIVVAQLREFGKVNWSWTGLQLQPLRDFNKDTYFEGTEGVIVAGTDPESPARRAGFRPRDRILAVNGESVTVGTQEDLPELNRFLGLLPKDQPAEFTVQRAGEITTLTLTPTEKGKVEGEELDCPRWDFTVKTINQFDNPDLHFHRKEGVFIYGIKYPGNAASAGLSRNDIVLTIDGENVVTLDDVQRIHERTTANIDQKPRIVLTVLRNGLFRQFVLDMTRDYEKE